MRFTNSPYEDFMKEKSYFKGVPPSLPPKGSHCDGCPYWRGIAEWLVDKLHSAKFALRDFITG